MKNNKMKVLNENVTEYNLNMLLNDIQNDMDENEPYGLKRREAKSKLIIIQALIQLAGKYSDSSYSSETKLRNALDYYVNDDERLSCYMFFLSLSGQFDYTWNYLREHKKGFVEFLLKAIPFIKSVVSDINEFAGKAVLKKDMHVVLNNFFDVFLIGESSSVKAQIHWENFHLLNLADSFYNVKVTINDVVLTCGIRKSPGDVLDLIEKSLELLKNKEK